MQKVWALKKGFTIIELLVSIVVIGILISITIASYTNIQQRARDSERESDITQVKIALEKYHADKSMYPPACLDDDVVCTISFLASELQPYLKVIPHDPRFTAGSVDDYSYVRSDTSNDGYGLKVKYESKAECKTGENIDTTWWSSTVPTC